MNTDIKYKDGRQVRGKLKQQGSYVNQQGSFSYYNTIHRPLLAQMRLYERLWRQDLTIKAALRARTQWLLGTIGEIQHPDKEIAEFHNRNLKQLEDLNGRSFYNCLEVMNETKYWAGNSVSEILFHFSNGKLFLQDLITYHPKSIIIYTDKKGRLVQGKETPDGYHRSGIWQLSSGFYQKEKQLDLWKLVHLTNESDFGNYYGRSLIAPSYKWTRLKEALIDMMSASLYKLGNRVLWVKMPSFPTQEVRVDPSTGEENYITTLQLIKEQFDETEGIPEVIFLPYQQQGTEPEVGSEAIQDPVGDLFVKAIEYADHQSIKHIIPSFLLTSMAVMDGREQEVAQERQIELFTNSIELERQALLSNLIRKIFIPLQQWNFNRAAASIPPTFSRVYSDRSEDRVATMQMIKGLVESAVLNPRNDEDYTKIMQMLRLGTRVRDEDDMKFIEEILIEPRKKQPREGDVGPKGSGSPGRSTGNKSKQISKKQPKRT
jgi:hypothetical protein